MPALPAPPPPQLPPISDPPARREVVVYFSVINEVMSLYADENAEAMGFTSIDGAACRAGWALLCGASSCLARTGA